VTPLISVAFGTFFATGGCTVDESSAAGSLQVAVNNSTPKVKYRQDCLFTRLPLSINEIS